MSQIPPPCNSDIFKNGHSICALDARSQAAEHWVKRVAAISQQSVDWHYSGGIANVLYIGDYDKVLDAVKQIEKELDGRVMKIFPKDAHGLYRAGDPLPEGTIAVSTIEQLFGDNNEQH